MEDKANAEVLGGGEITFSNDGSEAYLCLITTDKTKSEKKTAAGRCCKWN